MRRCIESAPLVLFSSLPCTPLKHLLYSVILRKTVDCIIAATAIENGLTPLHKDCDFDRTAACTGLKVL